MHAWGARLLATLAAQPSCAADALQALRPRGAEAAGVEAQEGKTTMLLPRLYAGLQKGLEDTGKNKNAQEIGCRSRSRSGVATASFQVESVLICLVRFGPVRLGDRFQ